MNKRIGRLFLAWSVMAFPVCAYSTSEEPEDRVDVVVLDAGHGGKDPGALGKRSKEKDIVLAITLKVGEYIREYLPDVKVIYTREDDEFVELHERADIANRNKADLFISIHANWYSSTRAYGAETFTMGTSADKRNLEVAMLENSVITMEEDYSTHYEGFDPNSPESYIIFNLMQKTFLQQSVEFARLVQDQFRDRARRFDRGVKQERFLVLWKTTMPSVLIETGFITNPTEEAYLLSRAGQEYLASAIFRAFRDYKKEIEDKSPRRTAATAPAAKNVRPETRVVEASTDEVLSNPEVHYMIQVLTTTRNRELQDPLFEGFGHVAEFRMNNLYKYAVLKATSFEAVYAELGSVQQRFPGAFVIAVRDGKIIPVSEARNQNK